VQGSSGLGEDGRRGEEGEAWGRWLLRNCWRTVDDPSSPPTPGGLAACGRSGAAVPGVVQPAARGAGAARRARRSPPTLVFLEIGQRLAHVLAPPISGNLNLCLIAKDSSSLALALPIIGNSNLCKLATRNARWSRRPRSGPMRDGRARRGRSPRGTAWSGTTRTTRRRPPPRGESSARGSSAEVPAAERRGCDGRPGRAEHGDAGARVEQCWRGPDGIKSTKIES